MLIFRPHLESSHESSVCDARTLITILLSSCEQHIFLYSLSKSIENRYSIAKVQNFVILIVRMEASLVPTVVFLFTKFEMISDLPRKKPLRYHMSHTFDTNSPNFSYIYLLMEIVPGTVTKRNL